MLRHLARPSVAGLVAFALALPLALALLPPSAIPYDSDSEYHLAIARAYARQGIRHDFPWARFSLLGNGFGDKELLFHLLLVPFAAGADPLAGGRLALALLQALVLAALAAAATRAVGAWAVAVPFFLVVASTELDWRLVRLRPELLSLLLILAAVVAAARRRPVWLGGLGLLYALSYVAVPTFAGLCVLLFLAYGLFDRSWEPRLALYPVVGCGVGLLVHPQFPSNLVMVWVQNVEYFRWKGVLDVGSEIRPDFTDVALMVNLGLWLAALALGLARRAGPIASPSDPQAGLRERLALGFAVATAVFGALYLLMSRFALYALPLGALALLYGLRCRDGTIGGWVRLPGRGRLPLAAALALALLVALPEARRQLAELRARTSPGPHGERLADRRAFGGSVPEDAKVAAPWRSTPIYMLWAPQGRYLNVLDPVLMALEDLEAYELQRRVFAGLEPDVPLVVASRLDSTYLAFPRQGDGGAVVRRLVADPRARAVLRGSHELWALVPSTREVFALDWQVFDDADLPAANRPLGSYPRALTPRGAAYEGYVDARRVGGAKACVGFAHDLSLGAARHERLELAAAGPATLWLDGELVVANGAAAGAVLGEGTVVELDLAPGRHRLVVRSCPVGGEPPINGFYLVDRTPRPAS